MGSSGGREPGGQCFLSGNAAALMYVNEEKISQTGGVNDPPGWVGVGGS